MFLPLRSASASCVRSVFPALMTRCRSSASALGGDGMAAAAADEEGEPLGASALEAA
jgi:hypothetical protein